MPTITPYALDVARNLDYIAKQVFGLSRSFVYTGDVSDNTETSYDAIVWTDPDYPTPRPWSDILFYNDAAYELSASRVLYANPNFPDDIGDLQTDMATAQSAISAAQSALGILGTPAASTTSNDSTVSGTTVKDALQTLASSLTSKATPADISAAIAALVNSAPGTLDTLAEIATALAADESVASALATTVAGKSAKASFSALTALAAHGLSTQATNASTTQVTNYNFVSGVLGLANGLNDANTAQNDLAAKYNALATAFNSLLSWLGTNKNAINALKTAGAA